MRRQTPRRAPARFIVVFIFFSICVAGAYCAFDCGTLSQNADQDIAQRATEYVQKGCVSRNIIGLVPHWVHIYMASMARRTFSLNRARCYTLVLLLLVFLFKPPTRCEVPTACVCHTDKMPPRCVACPVMSPQPKRFVWIYMMRARARRHYEFVRLLAQAIKAVPGVI